MLANAIVVTVDNDFRIIAPGSVAIDGTRIVAVDTAEAIAGRYAARERIDLDGHIVLPGLVNAHTHAPMVLYRGLADDLALMDWLEGYIFPAEARTVSPAFVRTGTALAAIEMIRSGTTLFADMYYFEEEVAAVTRQAGLRGVLGQTIIQFRLATRRHRGPPRRRLHPWHKDDPIVPSVAPQRALTNDEATLLAARDLAATACRCRSTCRPRTSCASPQRHGRRPVGYLTPSASGRRRGCPRRLGTPAAPAGARGRVSHNRRAT